jgi:predicted AAA+ superfamily ATPase
LIPANEIVLIGHGTGKSSAVETLLDYLAKHRADVLRHIVATEVVDLSALTAPDVEAIAKRHLLAAG